MKKDVLIADSLSKSFRLPHEKITSIRKAFIHAFKQKTYENFEPVKNVSFSVKKGEFFSIVGKNGSGKSTLLKILAGIYSPDTGSVQIEGKIAPFIALGIGFHPDLTGRENIYLNATLLGLTKKEIDERFDAIVEFSELERFIDQKIQNYSSGMNSRLAFSVAIHVSADILIMDEVLAVGDEQFQQKCLSVFEKFIKEEKTIIFVSHSLEVVQTVSDRVMVLHEGENKGIFTPEEGIATYRHLIA